MKKRGFTLLELLVVIGIIAILVAMGTVSYSAAQRAGRDSRRRQDLLAMQNALEEYYGNNTSQRFTYPSADVCTGAEAYLKSAWPVDPLGGADGITLDSVDYTYHVHCSVDRFTICAALEGNGGNAANYATAADTTINWTNDAANARYFCVTNLQ